MKCTEEKKKASFVLKLLIENFFEHDVGKNAAALAYYLLFAIFPLLIFLSNLLGLLGMDITTVIQTLQRILPKEIIGILETYLAYVSETSSPVLLIFSLVFSIWFPMRVAKGLMDDVRLAYHLEPPKQRLKYIIRQLAYTVLLLLVICLSLIFVTIGRHILVYVNNLLPENTMHISEYAIGLWQYLRFIPTGVLMFLALGVLYAISLDKKQPAKTLMPGIAAALTTWMLVSIGFSFYVENFGNYSIIYGTLGAVIVLLMWLYMTAAILILGAEFNAALLEIDKKC